MLTLKTIASLPPGLDPLGSRQRRGNRVRRSPTKRRSRRLRSQVPHRRRPPALAYHRPPWCTLDAGHGSRAARRILVEVADGGDPAGSKQDERKAATVGDLCDDYLESAKAGRVLTRRRAAKKASTLATDASRISRYIRPLLGHLKVAAVTRATSSAFTRTCQAEHREHLVCSAACLPSRPPWPAAGQSCPRRRTSRGWADAAAPVGSRICRAGQGFAASPDAHNIASPRRQTSSLSRAGGAAKCSRSNGTKPTSSRKRRGLPTPRPARHCAPCQTPRAPRCASSPG